MSWIKAKISVIYGQHDRAVKYLKKFLIEEPSAVLDEKELSWFANAYNHIAQIKRNCIMEIDNSVRYMGDYEKVHILSVLDEIRDELICICADVIDLIDRNLLHNVRISTREKVFAYKIKGDFLRYMWEANSKINTYEQATKAYYEAMSICQWNYEPTDVYLLLVTMNYTVHLINANYSDKAIIILKQIISDALEDQEKYYPTNKLLIELLLKYLNGNLVRFQKPVDTIGFEVYEHCPKIIIVEEELMNFVPDDIISRKRR